MNQWLVLYEFQYFIVCLIWVFFYITENIYVEAD